MTVDELVAFVRENLLDDTVEPYLWSDDVLTTLAFEAEREACRRGDLLIDNINHSFVTQENVAEYSMSSQVIRPIKMDITDGSTTITLARMNLGNAPPLSDVKGLPQQYVYVNDTTIRLYPIPDKEYQVSVIASVYPPSDAVDFTIDSQYHLALAYYVAGYALLKEDSEAYDPNQASLYLSIFDNKFGDSKTFTSLQKVRMFNNSDLALSNAKLFGFY